MPAHEVNIFHTFENGVAYTEDKLLVYKLLVRLISSKTKDEEVLAYFSQFGEVVKMFLRPERRYKLNNFLKSVTIHYADARVAAKVLKKPIHILMKRIHVSACHSWEQPGAFKSNDHEEIEASVQNAADSGACGGATTSQPAPPLNVLDLNDDCLEHVAKFLRLEEQVRMARTCTRFSGAVEMRLRVEPKLLWLDELGDMTLWDIRELFLMAGPTVRSLIGELPTKYNDQVIELIANHCPNVRRLYLNCDRMLSCTLHRIIANMDNITELQLHHCLLTDGGLKVIQKLSKLEQISLSGNHEITGKYLSKLTMVRTLNLNGCYSIETEYFIDIVKSMKELRVLNIRNCYCLSSKAFEEMAKHCANLVILQMSCRDIPYGSIARLPSMKRLELSRYGQTVDESVFKSLAEHKSTQLEFFKITATNCINLRSAVRIAQLSQLKYLVLNASLDLNDDCLYQFSKLEQLEEIGLRNCIHFTNDGLLHLIRRCTKLSVVNIQNCLQITNDFIYGVIELLSKRQQGLPQTSKKNWLFFYVLGTGISRQTMEYARCKNASILIEVFYHCYSTRCVAEDYSNPENFDELYVSDEDYEENDGNGAGDEDVVDLARNDV